MIYPNYLIMFQFHYGSIKRVTSSNGNNIRIKFQFHYGSIKSTNPIYANDLFD